MKFSTVTLLVLGQALALNPKDYPAEDVVPKVNQDWADAFLKGVSIPNIPIRQRGSGPMAQVDATPDRNTCNGANHWALTYDDGSSKFTQRVLDQLSKKGAVATFFVVGSRLVTMHKELKETYDQGHQIAMHSWSHTALSTLTNEEIVTEMVWTSKIIRDITGRSPKHVRVPFGDIDPRVRAVLKAMNLEIIYWSHDTNDWKLSSNPTPDFTPQTVLNQFKEWTKEKKGAISLQHDIYDLPTSLVGRSLDILSDANVDFRSVAACVDVDAYDSYVFEKTKPKNPISSPVPTSTKVEPTTKVEVSTKAEATTKAEASTKVEVSTKAEATTKVEVSTQAEATTKAEASTKIEVSTKAEATSKAEATTKAEASTKADATIVPTASASQAVSVVITSTKSADTYATTSITASRYSPKPEITYTPKTPYEAYEGVHLPQVHKDQPKKESYDDDKPDNYRTEIISSAVKPVVGLFLLSLFL